MFDFFDERQPTLPKEAAFKLLDAIVPKRTSLPCLKWVKVVGDADYLTFEATDLDYAVRVRCDNWDGFVGIACFVWSEFKAQHGLRPLSLIPQYAVGDFPVLPEVSGEDVGTGWLEEGRKVLYAVSTDRTRLALNGVYVHGDGVVATDGHRLHLVPGTHAADMIVPPRVFKLAKDAPKSAKDTPKSAKATTTTLHIVYPWGHIASKLIEGPYPNYRQILIKSLSGRKVARVDVEALKDACFQACQLNKGAPKVYLHSRAVWVETSGGKWVRSFDTTMPEGFEIQFNAAYVPDTLVGIRGHVDISIATSVQAVLFNPSEFGETRILMPTRVTKA